MSHCAHYLSETIAVAWEINANDIETLAEELFDLKSREGRLYIAGLGGSAANASHAANDFKKLCGIDAVCLTDNVAEVTSRANDEGWQTIFNLDAATENDALLVLSVGGGSDGVSRPLIEAIDLAQEIGMTILGIVGRDGGHLKKHGDCVVMVPNVAPERVTPHAEGWQSVILHCLVSHPELQTRSTKW